MRSILILALLTVTLGAAKILYTYDDAGRLAKVDYGDGKTISYTYDKAGNLLKREASGDAPAPAAATEKKKPAPAKPSKN